MSDLGISIVYVTHTLISIASVLLAGSISQSTLMAGPGVDIIDTILTVSYQSTAGGSPNSTTHVNSSLCMTSPVLQNRRERDSTLAPVRGLVPESLPVHTHAVALDRARFGVWDTDIVDVVGISQILLLS